MEIRCLIENKINEAYLRMLFGSNKSGPIKISRSIPIGKFIISHVKYSNKLPKQSIGTTLLIPNYNKSRNLINKFGYISIEDQLKIADNLNFEFIIWSRDQIAVSLEMGYSKNDSIYILIDQLNLRNDPTIFELLKKRDYRRRKNIAKNVKFIASQFGYNTVKQKIKKNYNERLSFI